MEGIQYEVLFVDDGSTDETLHILQLISEGASNIGYLSLSRNFGQQVAIKAGLDHANGDCLVMMDVDMEHPPELIPEMIKKWMEGNDIVVTYRKTEGAKSFFRRISSLLFYRFMNFLSDTKVEYRNADFRLLDHKVVQVLRQFSEQPIFLRALVNWLGFKKATISFDSGHRYAGDSKYSKLKLFNLFIEGITSFSIKPLRISSFLGLLLSLFSILYGIYAIYVHLFTEKAVPGWTSLLVLIALIGGIQLIMIGVLGEYIGKLFMASKNRPSYLLKDKSK